jgi:hypothetical protein
MTISFYLELCFDQIYSRWKDLCEQKMMVSSKGGWEMVEGRKKINTPSLKWVLRGLVVLQQG